MEEKELINIILLTILFLFSFYKSFSIIFYYQTDEIQRQLKIANAKAVITVAEIAPIVLQASRDILASGGHLVVIEDGSGPIPDGTVPFKVRTKIDHSVEHLG